MKAIVYNGIQEVQVRNVPDAKIEKKDDIIIKVTSTAICGSDLHLVHGMIKNFPHGFVLGHETMGIVEEVVPEVHTVKKVIELLFPSPFPVGIAGSVSIITSVNAIILIPIERS